MSLRWKVELDPEVAFTRADIMRARTQQSARHVFRDDAPFAALVLAVDELDHTDPKRRWKGSA